MADGVGGADCDRTALSEHLNPIAAAGASVAALEAQCVPGAAAARPIAEMNFQETVDHGRACIALAGLPADAVADLRSEIDRLVLEESPSASQFVKTMNAFNSGEKLSYLTLGIAAAIDLLVLFSGLIGATSGAPGRTLSRRFHRRATRHVKQRLVRALAVDTTSDADDPISVRNAKLVLRHIEPYSLKDKPDHHAHAPINVEASLSLADVDDSEDKIAIKQTMQALVSAGLVYSDKTDHYEIGLGALDILRQEIVRHTPSSRPILGGWFGGRAATARPLRTKTGDVADQRGEADAAPRETSPRLGPVKQLEASFDKTWATARADERPAPTRGKPRTRKSLADAKDESEVDHNGFKQDIFAASNRMTG